MRNPLRRCWRFRSAQYSLNKKIAGDWNTAHCATYLTCGLESCWGIDLFLGCTAGKHQDDPYDGKEQADYGQPRVLALEPVVSEIEREDQEQDNERTHQEISHDDLPVEYNLFKQ